MYVAASVVTDRHNYRHRLTTISLVHVLRVDQYNNNNIIMLLATVNAMVLVVNFQTYHYSHLKTIHCMFLL